MSGRLRKYIEGRKRWPNGPKFVWQACGRPATSRKTHYAPHWSVNYLIVFRDVGGPGSPPLQKNRAIVDTSVPIWRHGGPVQRWWRLVGLPPPPPYIIIYAKRGAGPLCGHSYGGSQLTASPTESNWVHSGSTSWSLLWRITNYSESNRVQLSPTCVHSYAETQSTSVLNRSRHVCEYALPSIWLDVPLHMQVPRVL